MKILHPETIRTTAMAVTSALCLQAAITSAQLGEKAAETEFQYVIQPESGATEFAPGDRIRITSVRGNREHLEPGGRYLLEGSYMLASADSADLAWFATSRGPSGSTPVTDDEHVRITRGSGNFHLEKTLLDDGWLHVTFYVNGHSHGGIYFGEKDFDNTVLRKKDWSDFSNDSPGGRPDRKSAGARNGGTALSGPANLAIMAYLGDPVSPPAGLDARYSPTNLLAAFTALSQKQGLRVERLALDDSEFPFLVYGVLAGKHDFRELEAGLHQMKDYKYGGSVVGITDKGGTYFSFNMIPYSQYPSGQAAACNRRLMVRLQMLADAVRQAE
jgi:hypothetical protein